MTSVAPFLRRLRQEAVQRHIKAENSGDLDAMVASFHRPRYEVLPMDAVCEGEAHSVFQVSKKGELTILDERPGDDARAAVEAAVRYCPTHALSIEEA